MDAAANGGSAADIAKAAVALGASAAGASKAPPFGQASAYLGLQLASGLIRLGRAGGLAAQLGIAYDFVTGDYTSAVYDTADFYAYFRNCGLRCCRRN